MATKPTTPRSLSVHRNTVEKRRARVLADDLVRQVGSLVKERDIRAYAVVGIGADGKAYALWDTGAVMPMRAFPAVMMQVLADDIAGHDLVEDWKPALTVRP